MSITVFGSINVDLTAYVERLPRPGVTAHAASYATGLGGKGANQAVAAQRLSTSPVRLVAAVGSDGFGERAQILLSEFGVSKEDLIVMSGKETGIALIHVDAASQNTITVVGGANMAWSDQGPDPAVFHEAKVALFQLEVPMEAIASAMRAAQAAGARIILDPAPAPERSKVQEIDALLRLADIVTPNESEAEALTGISIADQASALQAAQALRVRGVKTVVVKLGAEGLVYIDGDGTEGVIAPFEVAAVDSVAAGDCFNGALAVALAEGRSILEALRFASAAGALSTEKPGAASAAPSRDQLELFLSRSYRFCRFKNVAAVNNV
jgi:ribokinase